MNVFISRTQAEHAVFRKRLESEGVVVFGQSLVQFEPVEPALPLPKAQWYFFYSQRGVDFFFAFLEKNKVEIPQAQWAAIGHKTALRLVKHIGPVDFVGNGEPEETAAVFEETVRGQRVVFVQAKHSQESIEKRLSKWVYQEKLVVYDNFPLQNPPDLSDFEILVFTSPLNVNAYFSNFPLLPHQKTVAIGGTTAAALEALGLPVSATSKEPSEKGLAECVLGGFGV